MNGKFQWELGFWQPILLNLHLLFVVVGMQSTAKFWSLHPPFPSKMCRVFGSQMSRFAFSSLIAAPLCLGVTLVQSGFPDYPVGIRAAPGCLGSVGLPWAAFCAPFIQRSWRKELLAWKQESTNDSSRGRRHPFPSAALSLSPGQWPGLLHRKSPPANHLALLGSV